MDANEPTLLMIHGAWHGAWVWDRLREELPEVSCVALDLPSAGDTTKNADDDVAAVRAAVAQLDGPIVVLAHSRGGFAATEALDPESSVRRIIYLAAIMPEVGETRTHRYGAESFPSWWAVHDDAVTPTDPQTWIYPDVPDAEARQAIARLVPQSVASMLASPSRAAWEAIPSTYILCEQDDVLPTAIQETIARRTQRVYRLPGAHSPMLARPRELAEIVRAELSPR